jgi:hypothetical protein
MKSTKKDNEITKAVKISLRIIAASLLYFVLTASITSQLNELAIFGLLLLGGLAILLAGISFLD